MHGREGEVDQCSFPTDSGSCDDTTAHWFFNKHTGFCEKVAHGGCSTTNPGFQSEEECNVQCVAPGAVSRKTFAAQHNSSNLHTLESLVFSFCELNVCRRKVKCLCAIFHFGCLIQ